METDGLPAEVTLDDGVDVDSIEERRVDDLILHRAILGHDLADVFSNKRLQLAADRHFTKKLLRIDTSEMFSPERVTVVCRDYGLEPGQAMDLKHGYDLDLGADRQRARESILKYKPMLVVGSPPFTYFSRLQEFNKHMHRDNAVVMGQFHEQVDQAKRYVGFCVQVYNHQLDNNTYF